MPGVEAVEPSFSFCGMEVDMEVGRWLGFVAFITLILLFFVKLFMCILGLALSLPWSRGRKRRRRGGRRREGGREDQQATKRDTRDRGKEEGQCITRCESDCFKYYYQGIMGISPRCPELNARAKSSSCCRRCVYRSHHARWFQFTVPPLC